MGTSPPSLTNRKILKRIRATKILIIFTGIDPTSFDAAPKN